MEAGPSYKGVDVAPKALTRALARAVPLPDATACATAVAVAVAWRSLRPVGQLGGGEGSEAALTLGVQV